MPTKSEMHALVRAGRSIEVFEHETQGIFNISHLRLGIELGIIPYKRCRAYIDDRMKYIIKECRDIDEDRVMTIIKEGLIIDPSICILCEDGDHILVDGTHRIAALIRLGFKDFRFYEVEKKYAPMVDIRLYKPLPNYGDPDFIEKMRGREHPDVPECGTVDGKKIEE